ncbi:high mobility group nucleosome-binding domain-containing protein 3 isoform 2 [Tachysurus ichikawai]
MPKRKSPEGAEGKDSTKVTKQEPTRRSMRLSTKASDEKVVKGKKGGAKGKKEEKEAVPAENGETEPEGICISRSSVTVSAPRSPSPTPLSITGQKETESATNEAEAEDKE